MTIYGPGIGFVLPFFVEVTLGMSPEQV